MKGELLGALETARVAIRSALQYFATLGILRNERKSVAERDAAEQLQADLYQALGAIEEAIRLAKGGPQ
jgi:hypothetical protein